MLKFTRFQGRLPEEHKRYPNRRVSDPRALRDNEDPTPERFLADFACFYNLIYSQRPIGYLERCTIIFDVLHICEYRLWPNVEVSALTEMLLKYQGCKSLTLQLDIPVSVNKTWEQWFTSVRNNPQIMDNFTFLTATAKSVGIQNTSERAVSDPIALCVLIADRDSGCTEGRVKKKVVAELLRSLRPSLV